jgi:uncharacterized protein YaaW (UPF0174 family)
MEYRYDNGLEFLQYCSNDELNFFIELFEKKGGITAEIFREERFEKFYPNHKKYWDLIAAEIQLYGGNTILNFFNGKGVLYKDILMYVCDKNLVVYDKNSDVATIEKFLIYELLKKEIDSLNASELEKFKEEFHLEDIENINLLFAIKRKIFNNSDFYESFLTELFGHKDKIIEIIKDSVIKKSIKSINPVFGMAYLFYEVSKSIFDPAYRIIFPAVLYIAYLREKYKDKDKEFRIRFEPKIGSILRTELVGNVVDHSGIYVGDGKIVEIFNDNGMAKVKEVNFYEFTYSSNIRTGKTIYIAVDKLTKEVIFNEKIAQEAKKHIGKMTEYELLKNNCHSFVCKCIQKVPFEEKVEVVFFSELERVISKYLNDERMVDWEVCDINPLEFKKDKKNWSIEQEVV